MAGQIETAYRIAKTRHSASHGVMFSGAGAAAQGGRWNSPGKPVVYASETRALATLEIIAHLKNPAVLEAYSICQLHIPGRLCMKITVAELPNGWDELVVNPLVAQAFGDEWLESGITPALKVPSAVMPDEFNYLLNPEHDDFADIELGDIEPYPIDERIGVAL